MRASSFAPLLTPLFLMGMPGVHAKQGANIVTWGPSRFLLPDSVSQLLCYK